MTTRIWYEDIVGFVHDYNLIPMGYFTIEQKLNALVRLFIVAGLVFAFIRADARFLFLGIIAAIVSILIYNYHVERRTDAEKFLEQRNLDVINSKLCTRTTVENPFMNPSIYEIAANPTRPSACDISRVKDAVDANFKARLYRDTGDLYGIDGMPRQFYTMPSTTIPNNRESFQTWLFERGPSCKEGNGVQCFHNKAVTQLIGGYPL